MKAKSGIIIAIIVMLLTCSHGSSEEPETREEFEQKVKQQQEKIRTLETQILEQTKAIINLKSEAIELRKKIYYLKYETEPDDINDSKDKNTRTTKLQAFIKNQQVEIERMRRICRNAGIDPNSEPNNIKKLMTEEEEKAYQKRLANYGDWFKKKKSNRIPVSTIPADVTYSIIDSDTYLDWKRSLDVRLNKKVSKATLRAIALKLKSQDSRNYERTFICYYLPDMEVGAGAYATTHFNPNLEVRIQGLTTEQEKILKQQPNDPSREVIGSWLDETPYMGRRITIFRQNGKLFMESVYYDGSSGKKEIVEKLSGRKRTFRRKEGSSVGEFYLIDKQGNLQMWDEEGIISTAKKIN